MIAGRAEQRAGLLDGVEAGLRVELIGHQDRHRRSARDDRLERPALAHAARVAVDQLAQRDVHRRFVHAGRLHVAADAVQLRAAVLLGAEAGVPLRALRDDQRHIAERLDVVHRRRLAVEADDRRKRRLVARLRALAFERFEQRGLFARLVGAGAAVDEDVAVEARCRGCSCREAPSRRPRRSRARARAARGRTRRGCRCRRPSRRWRSSRSRTLRSAGAGCAPSAGDP